MSRYSNHLSYFLTLKAYCAISGNMPLQNRDSHKNSQWHFDNKQEIRCRSCPPTINVTITPHLQTETILFEAVFMFYLRLSYVL